MSESKRKIFTGAQKAKVALAARQTSALSEPEKIIVSALSAKSMYGESLSPDCLEELHSAYQQAAEDIDLTPVIYGDGA